MRFCFLADDPDDDVAAQQERGGLGPRPFVGMAAKARQRGRGPIWSHGQHAFQEVETQLALQSAASAEVLAIGGIQSTPRSERRNSTCEEIDVLQRSAAFPAELR